MFSARQKIVRQFCHARGNWGGSITFDDFFNGDKSRICQPGWGCLPLSIAVMRRLWGADAIIRAVKIVDNSLRYDILRKPFNIRHCHFVYVIEKAPPVRSKCITRARERYADTLPYRACRIDKCGNASRSHVRRTTVRSGARSFYCLPVIKI